MAELIGVVGESGSGKTSSLRNLDPSKTFIITPTGKRPGIPGAKKKYKDLEQNPETKEFTGNFYTTTNVDALAKVIRMINVKMPHIKYVVCDDYQYYTAFEALSRAKEKSWN